MGYKAKTQSKNRANQNKNFRRVKGARRNGPPSPFGPLEELLIHTYLGKLNQADILSLLILTFRKPFTLNQLHRYMKTNKLTFGKNIKSRIEEIEIPAIDRDFILSQIPESVKKEYDKMFEEENVDAAQEK